MFNHKKLFIMKGFKFFAYSLLLLAFCFTVTVTAKEQTFTKIKTELAPYQTVDPLVEVTFDTPTFVQSNCLQFEPVKIVNYNHQNFGTIIDVGWRCNSFVSNYSIYKEQLNSQYLVDKRQLLQITGVKYKHRSC